MSILVDDLVNVYKPGNCTYRRVGTRTYIAKPCPYYGFQDFIRRIKDAFKVLIGKGYVYHYWEDIDEG